MYTSNQITFSKHAHFERMQQRGVNQELPQLWIDYGFSAYQHNGCVCWYLNNTSFERMRRDGVDKSLIIMAEKKRTLCVVTNSDGNFVLTVIHEHRNRHNYRYTNAKHTQRRIVH